MPTDATFRLSTYLTLALSCACVGYAESGLLPEVGFIATGVIVALAILYRLEGRVELLAIPAANRLGVVLGLANLGWAVMRMIRELRRSDAESTTWQSFLVALVGPLLITLMPAKLARREKHVGDYWGLYVMGLGGVALAGAMADDLTCCAVIALYAGCALWSLTLFHLRLASGAVLPVPGRVVPTPVAGVIASTERRAGLPRVLTFLVLAATVAVPLYLITPRSPGDKFTFGKPRVEIGYAADQMTDLNQVGDLKANDQLAFEVRAEVDGQPRTNLAPEQRWRGRILRRYVNGTWRVGEGRLPGIEPATRNVAAWSIPRLGPGQCTLTFTVPARLRSSFLAEPVAWVGGEPPPVATLTPEGPRGWIWVGDGSFLSATLPPLTAEPLHYVQAWRTGDDADLSPPFRLIESDPGETLRPLRDNPVPRVREYADAVLDGLIRDGKLPAACRNPDPVRLLPRLEFHDRIASAFATYLATTPDLTYTTDLRRENKKIDPIEEFLFHTRAGHCERFASALTLMLRSQGIPAVMVLGFKGCEQTTEPGKYVVREEHAHAWVEALIQVFEPRPGGRPVSRWRSLDPTPASAPVHDSSTAEGWVEKTGSRLRNWYRKYVGDYTAEHRRQALEEIAGQVTRKETLVALSLAIAAAFLLRSLLRRQRRPGGPLATLETRWFDRLLAILANHGFLPAPGETPREFTVRVAAVLRQNAATLAVAEVPLNWSEAYYEIRFGNVPLAPDRHVALREQLEELTEALRR